MSTFGQWEYTCDQDTTAKVYSTIERGDSDACTCNGCRNFVAAREKVFPSEFLSLLASLGIDSRKDGEVYHNGKLAPGRHDYGGWFHFIGTLESTGDFPVVAMGDSFTACMLRNCAPALSALNDYPLVQIEFHASNVPWVLNEAEDL
jgi:hypothetical protein